MPEDQAQEEPGSAPKRSVIGAMVSMVLPALVAGAASFGGATVGTARAEPAEPPPPAASEESAVPGPTVRMTPFVLTVTDESGQPHAMKISIALELTPDAQEEDFSLFVPRVRDAVLSLLRSSSFETISDSQSQEKLRSDLLDRIHALGATAAERVLFTDFVIQ